MVDMRPEVKVRVVGHTNDFGDRWYTFYCPNCGSQVANREAKCPDCRVLLLADSWYPKEADGER